jgi:Arc/MetJ-type ribon-helix-helix transcriptional regulator
MNYSIPIDVLQRIDAQLAGGGFSSPDQVLREAIDALERRQRGIETLRAMVTVAEEDVVAGRVAPLDRAAIQREVRDRLAAQGIRE